MFCVGLNLFILFSYVLEDTHGKLGHDEVHGDVFGDVFGDSSGDFAIADSHPGREVWPVHSSKIVSVGCKKGVIPKTLKPYKHLQKAGWTSCRDTCALDTRCHYFKWKVSCFFITVFTLFWSDEGFHTSLYVFLTIKSKSCFLLKTIWTMKKSWNSGAKYCGLHSTAYPGK